MTQIKWKAAFLAFLLASSLHSIYTVQAEKGVTTATHIGATNPARQFPQKQ